jgi:hypothetical protein
MISTLLAASQPPAGGAAIGQIVIATAGALIVTTALLVLGFGHRSGRVPYLGRLAAFSSKTSGLPGWAALPSAIATVSLITAVFGMYWDISIHIDQGRDEGPLANPAHYFILGGLFGIFAAGFVAMVLPKGDKPSSSAIKLSPSWYAPLGGVLICACGAFALLGFPLDDLWHRMFGQDVTLWGPTHLMLIGGASMTLIGIAVLLVEGLRANDADERRPREARYATYARGIALTGGLLLGLSTFQAEFDFGVPQFRFVFQPMMIMLASGVGLVAVRQWLGKGAAIGAVVFFIIVRGTLTILVDPILGETTPHFPLYVVEALIVEGVALAIPRSRPVAFGLASGAGIGTVGLAAEWGWSHIWMPIAWPASLLPEAAILGFAMAVAGSLIGVWVGSRLSITPQATPRPLRIAAVTAAVAVLSMTGYALVRTHSDPARATVTLAETQGGAQRMANASVRFEPADAADDANWLTVTAWQGGGLVVTPLKRVGEGRYETTEPIPLYGDWKTLVRLHKGNQLSAVPIYLPADEAIPVKGVPAPPQFTRSVQGDHTVLQREQKATSGALTAIAYLVVASIALGLLALLAWGLHRLGGAAPQGGSPVSARTRSARERTPATAPRPLAG